MNVCLVECALLHGLGFLCVLFVCVGLCLVRCALLHGLLFRVVCLCIRWCVFG